MKNRVFDQVKLSLNSVRYSLIDILPYLTAIVHYRARNLEAFDCEMCSAEIMDSALP